MHLYEINWHPAELPGIFSDINPFVYPSEKQILLILTLFLYLVCGVCFRVEKAILKHMYNLKINLYKMNGHHWRTDWNCH